MNVEDGRIQNENEILKELCVERDQLEQALGTYPYVPVAIEDMTPKQKQERRVSLQDHRSKLGKVLTAKAGGPQ